MSKEKDVEELQEEYNKIPLEIRIIITDLENQQVLYFDIEDNLILANIIKKHIDIIKFNAKLEALTDDKD